jgi:hypothetical protein
MSELTLSLTNVGPLGDGYVYEGWFIVDDTPVSTGRFEIEEGVTEYSFDVPTMDAENAAAFVLTIEPDPDDDPAPAATKLLGGAIEDGMADLSIAHMAAIRDDFSDASGEYLLQTPTSGDVADDYSQGIWFLDPSGDPDPSLMLPELPDGWVYEGWVVDVEGDGPVSTGRFTSVTGADSDGAGPAAGDDEAPPFPGQDFIDPARDLVASEYMVVVSLEPEPDDSPMPFFFKPLVDEEVTDVAPPDLQELTNMADTAPTGTVESE